jgi:hypothetical protein
VEKENYYIHYSKQTFSTEIRKFPQFLFFFVCIQPTKTKFVYGENGGAIKFPKLCLIHQIHQSLELNFQIDSLSKAPGNKKKIRHPSQYRFFIGEMGMREREREKGKKYYKTTNNQLETW